MQLVEYRTDVDPYGVLEAGGILYFSQTPFGISEDQKANLLATRQSDGGFHKNISYRPAQDRISGVGNTGAESVEKLRAAMREYSERVIRFAGELLPRYKDRWRIDYASFRPQEEEGRSLPWKKRNDLLHVDAFPTRPTNGDLILRVFTNIHPSKSRNWVTSDPFAPLAREYAKAGGLDRVSAKSDSLVARTQYRLKRMLRGMGIPVAARFPYDDFMLGFHDYLKQNAEYQQTCNKYRFEFPPNSTWLVFTDIVPHSVLSGRHALEQTLLISRETLANPRQAPIAILEEIGRTKLAFG